MEILLWLTALLSMSIISIQIAYESTLIQEIKSFIGLHEAPSYMNKLSGTSFYASLLRLHPGMWLLLPLYVIIFLMSNLVVKMIELINCPMCLSFHAGWIINYFYFNHNIIEALIYAPVCIFFVYLCEKLNG